MRKERFMTPSAVFAVIIKDNKILLQKRFNTGYQDGYFDVAASGHVEENETLIEAVSRELKEEINVDVSTSNIEFMTYIHRKDPETSLIYYDTYFLIKHFTGTPVINEPNKCDELAWFPLNDLPSNIIPSREFALQNYQNHIFYAEYGWK